ncbi:hypothetical protein Acr_21g0000240 [Actinidia rufa]|uniref:Uncharacterized protein n=1 Tax=Actinidia rufa TaxID=165716 RepID=A0A7J0GF74_9ERIC|nr:hypothetical protein Acr_21g0000240 [Actinidia rufa]
MESFSHHYHIRSISLEARSHPITFQIEEELNKLKTLKPSSSLKAETILTGLFSIGELEKSIEELLSLPPLAQVQRVNELLEELVEYIDVCSKTRDTSLVIKEGLQGLQSPLQRRKIGNDGRQNEMENVEIALNNLFCSNSRKDDEAERIGSARLKRAHRLVLD